MNKKEYIILIHLLETHIDKGEYFGNKENHYRMCKELLEYLQKQI